MCSICMKVQEVTECKHECGLQYDVAQREGWSPIRVCGGCDKSVSVPIMTLDASEEGAGKAAQ